MRGISGRKKGKDQLRHVVHRALERCGLELTQKDVICLGRYIQKADSENYQLVAKQTNTRSLCEVKYEGSWYFVVWDKTTKQIATFLTEEMATNWGYEVEGD